MHALIATGVNADGHREIRCLEVASAEDSAGCLAFGAAWVARGLSGVQLVTADAHHGLVAAIGAPLPGASWQRCRSHYLRALLTKLPNSAQPDRGHPSPYHLRPSRRRCGALPSSTGSWPPWPTTIPRQPST